MDREGRGGGVYLPRRNVDRWVSFTTAKNWPGSPGGGGGGSGGGPFYMGGGGVHLPRRKVNRGSIFNRGKWTGGQFSISHWQQSWAYIDACVQ